MSIADVTIPATLRRRSDGPRTQPVAHSAWWWVLAVAVVVAAIVLHVFSAWDANAPRTPWDENHVLQMARWISGDRNVTPLSGAGYYPGWSFMMAPIWWFTHDAATVYAAAIALGNVVAIATVIPLSMTAHRLGLTWPQSIAVGGLVMCLPARVVNADYVLAEKPLMFFMAWALLAAVTLWLRPTWWRMTLFALAIVATYFVHARALTLVIVAAIWIVLFARRRWILVPLGLAVLAVGSFAVREVSSAIHEHVLLTGFSQGSSVWTKLMAAPASDVVKVFVTQMWAQFVGTAGLMAVGLVLLVVWVWRELRRLHVGVGGFIFGVTLSTIAMSVISWAGSPDLEPTPGARFDASIYTRYIDPVAALISLIALVALVRVLSRGVIAVSLALATVASLLVVLWIAPSVPTWGNLNGPANSAAILSWDRFFPTGAPYEVPMIPWFTNPNKWWLLASIFVVAALVGCLLLRTRPHVLVTVGALALMPLSIAANQTQSRDYPNDIAAAVEEIEEVSSTETDIAINRDCRDSSLAIHQAVNWLPYWLAPREVTLVSIERGESFDSELVVACGWWPEAEEFGALPYDADTDYGYRLWVLEGDLQDELASQGRLLSLDDVGAGAGASAD
ncbi:hypothetical protein [Microbacterium sp. Marseille-Q6648]|uniref:hypothetical protein n=1 Tax=Microbacterium sp. Marseille-Q6648 TaxID=2937991 RepID=UPI00203B1478|nr:hypothetical protein [Microbacterium sp. Marseille-Q6648]